MNGAADLGGMMGFGPVRREANEPVFHADWERLSFGLTLAMAMTKSWSIDASRFTRESLPPGEYLTSSYYEIRGKALIRQLIEAGLVTEEELADGRVRARKALAVVPSVADAIAGTNNGAPSSREPSAPARFRIGDRVRAKNLHPATHTRLPRYLRGRAGEIVAVHGVHVFPDTNAHGGGENPTWLYGVCFAARELWGEDRPAGDSIAADCWEPYLEPA